MNTTEKSNTKIIEQYCYNSQEILGKGYSSVVYKGHEINTQQEVAIKVINRDQKKQNIHQKMIKMEIQMLTQLKSQPYIVCLLDVKQTENKTYIITQFCNQGTLKRYIDKKKGLEQIQALYFFKQILIGYQSLYNAGIVHRDIKPANILLKNNEVKIADFGFAIPINQIDQQQSMIIGSPMYMPYQALRKKQYSHKGDVWALGVTLFEMLCSQSPFKAKTQKQLIKQINYSSIKKIIPKKYSQKIQSMLIRMLEFDKNIRAPFEQIKQLAFGQQSLPTSLLTKNSQTNQRAKTRDCPSHDHSIQKSLSTKQQLPLPKIIITDRSSQQNKKSPKKSKNQNHHHQKLKTRKLTIKNNIFQQASQKTIQNNPTQDKYKQISHQLINQIHFCRFSYKLLIRMFKVSTQKIDKEIKDNICGLIFKKLQEIQNLSLIDQCTRQQYKLSKYWKQIQNIVTQYKSRYNIQIKKYDKKWINYSTFQDILEKQILKIYIYVKDLIDPKSQSDLVIILDYLITLKQLARLLEKQDLLQFHKHSKIQKIVEGVPSRNITNQHIKAIGNKLKGIRLI